MDMMGGEKMKLIKEEWLRDMMVYNSDN